MNKKYIIVPLVALLAIGGSFVYNRDNNLATITSDEQIEPTLARIDLSTPYTDESQFIVYSEDGQELPEATWLSKFNYRGYVVQKNGINCIFSMKSNNDIKVKLALRGPDKRDENNKVIENWVDFTSVTVNGEEILDENVAVWHNKPFYYTINAKAGETYNVVAKLQKHKEITE